MCQNWFSAIGQGLDVVVFLLLLLNGTMRSDANMSAALVSYRRRMSVMLLRSRVCLHRTKMTMRGCGENFKSFLCKSGYGDEGYSLAVLPW